MEGHKRKAEGEKRVMGGGRERQSEGDVKDIPLSGSVWGLIANKNRWRERGQDDVKISCAVILV